MKTEPSYLNKVPVIYKPDYVPNADDMFAALRDELAWYRRGQTPRMEYYCNKHNVPYVYGTGIHAREYHPNPWHPLIESLMEKINADLDTNMDVCFLNRYDSHKDQLGWHADDSPEMDDDRPIVIVSLGSTRDIWFKEQGASNDPQNVTKITLGHGSACIMKPHMQEEWYHRIPKHHVQECGTRISLTFRGYVTVDGSG